MDSLKNRDISPGMSSYSAQRMLTFTCSDPQSASNLFSLVMQCSVTHPGTCPVTSPQVLTDITGNCLFIQRVEPLNMWISLWSSVVLEFCHGHGRLVPWLSTQLKEALKPHWTSLTLFFQENGHRCPTTWHCSSSVLGFQMSYSSVLFDSQKQDWQREERQLS